MRGGWWLSLGVRAGTEQWSDFLKSSQRLMMDLIMEEVKDYPIKRTKEKKFTTQ